MLLLLQLVVGLLVVPVLVEPVVEQPGFVGLAVEQPLDGPVVVLEPLEVCAGKEVQGTRGDHAKMPQQGLISPRICLFKRLYLINSQNICEKIFQLKPIIKHFV